MFPLRYRIAGVVIAAGFLLPLSAARADVLGESHTFFTSPTYDASGASTVSATARAIGQNAYWYVDDRYWASLSEAQRNQFTSALNQFVGEFDSSIYPKSTSFWGSEAKPGVDGDPRVTVFLERLTQNAGGYFQTINNYPKSQAPDSNAREMFYVNVESVLTSRARDLTSHEFQHLISFNQKELLQHISDDTWLNEARSEYNITEAGYSEPFNGSSLQRRMFSFLSVPSDSLVDWPNTTTDYGIASLFLHYVADRFGPALAAWTIHSPTNGVVAIDDWLRMNSSERFPDLFTDWMAASYLNDPTIDARYAYARPGLSTFHITPQQRIALSTVSSSATPTSLGEWQPWWLQLDVPSSADATSAVNIQLAGQAGPWWGGAAIGTYADGHHRVIPFAAINGQSTVGVPVQDAAAHLVSVVLAITQGNVLPVDGRQLQVLPATVTATIGQPVATPAPTPVPTGVRDGDLIRHDSEPEIYVIWGPYRRYLRDDILALYGFQNRPVIAVGNDVFGRYTTSNYIRAVDGYKVYAVWPDGTKHWLNITAQQWDASGRDWNAIFIVNDAEVNFYTTGPDITR